MFATEPSMFRSLTLGSQVQADRSGPARAAPRRYAARSGGESAPAALRRGAREPSRSSRAPGAGAATALDRLRRRLGQPFLYRIGRTAHAQVLGILKRRPSVIA